jgi:threonine 3-dehydrogenase
VLASSGLEIAPVITHRFSHADHAEAFATAHSGASGKVILDWSDA